MMKYSVINDSVFHDYDTCDSIRLPYEIFKELGIDDSDLADVSFVNGKLVITPREVKCVITEQEFVEAVDSMVRVMSENFNDDSLYSSASDGAKAFLKELNIKVED